MQRLRDYIDDVRSGKLSMESINCLMDSLEELKQNNNYEKIKIELTTEELSVLVNRIYEYTIKLAKDNSVDLADDELSSSDNILLNLQKYLLAQKHIFELVKITKVILIIELIRMMRIFLCYNSE